MKMNADDLEEYISMLHLRAEKNLAETLELEKRFDSEEPNTELWHDFEASRMRTKLILVELGMAQADLNKLNHSEQENRGLLASALRTIKQAHERKKGSDF